MPLDVRERRNLGFGLLHPALAEQRQSGVDGCACDLEGPRLGDGDDAQAERVVSPGLGGRTQALLEALTALPNTVGGGV